MKDPRPRIPTPSDARPFPLKITRASNGYFQPPPLPRIGCASDSQGYSSPTKRGSDGDRRHDEENFDGAGRLGRRCDVLRACPKGRRRRSLLPVYQLSGRLRCTARCSLGRAPDSAPGSTGSNARNWPGRRSRKSRWPREQAWSLLDPENCSRPRIPPGMRGLLFCVIATCPRLRNLNYEFNIQMKRPPEGRMQEG